MSTPDQPPTHSCDLLSCFSWPLDGSVDVWLSFETDHLFEVAVEVSFSHNPYESWDQVARSLLLSVKALVSPPWPVSTFFHSSFYMEETPVGKFWMGFSSDYFCRSVNSWSIWVWYRQYLRKESKGLQQIGSIRSIFFFFDLVNAVNVVTAHFAAAFRLSGGVLYILWLHVGQSSGGQVHRAVHSALQELIAADVDSRGRHSKAVIMSLSTAGKGEFFWIRKGIWRQTVGWWPVPVGVVVKRVVVEVLVLKKRYRVRRDTIYLKV